MTMTYQKRAVGTFPTRMQAEQALRELKDSGFPMDRVSVIAKDENRPISDDLHGDDQDNDDDQGNKADEGAATGAATGGAIGTITGLLVGLGVLAIPGIGPIMFAGATATALATTAGGAAIGAAAGGLIGALVGLGIPEERARVYKERVSRGDYLVIVDGTEADIDRADTILNRGGIEEWGVYDARDPQDVQKDAQNQTDVVRRQETVAENRTPVVGRERNVVRTDGDARHPQDMQNQTDVVRRQETVAENRTPVVEWERNVVRTDGDVVYDDNAVKVVDHTKKGDIRR